LPDGTLYGQYAYQKGCSTSMPIHIIRRTIDYAAAGNDPIILCFLDWAKAFDSITFPALQQILQRYKLPSKYINTIMSFYKNPTFRVREGTALSSEYPQQVGIRQGCTLAPLLFILTQQVIIQDALQEAQLSRWDYPATLTRPVLLYADDTVLITDRATPMQRLLLAIEKHAAKTGLFLNPDKCEILTNITPKIVSMNGTRLKTKQRIKYLGSIISIECPDTVELNHRIGLSWSTIKQMTTLLRQTSANIKWKLQMITAFATSRLFYSLETLFLTRANLKRLDAHQLRTLRFLLRIPSAYFSRISDERVWQRARTIIPTLERYSETYISRVTRYLGHIHRSTWNDQTRYATLDVNGRIKTQPYKKVWQA